MSRLVGAARDKAVLMALQEWEVLDTEQLRLMFFTHATGLRKCQERMATLKKQGKVTRWRGAGEESLSYVYCIGKRKGHWEHKLAVNWVRMWFEKSLGENESIYLVDYEQNYKFLRTDAFIAIKNDNTNDFKFYFIEMERSEQLTFNKIKHYNDLFEKVRNGEYHEQWWTHFEAEFPTILIVTLTEQRRKNIELLLAAQNRNNLNFSIKTLDELRTFVRTEDRSATT